MLRVMHEALIDDVGEPEALMYNNMPPGLGDVIDEHISVEGFDFSVRQHTLVHNAFVEDKSFETRYWFDARYEPTTAPELFVVEDYMILRWLLHNEPLARHQAQSQ